MKLKGFVGPSYQLKSVNADAQRCINLFPEVIESGVGKEGEVAYLKNTPGLEKLFEIGNGPIRLIKALSRPYPSHTNQEKRAFLVVSGNEVFYVTFDGTNFSFLNLSSETLDDGPASDHAKLTTTSGPVSFEQVQGLSNSTLNALVTGVLVDGSNSPYFLLVYEEESAGNWYFNSYGKFYTMDFLSFYPPNANRLCSIDGYIIYTNGTNQYFCSEMDNIVVDPLSFASSEGDPDKIVSCIANNRYLWLLNERTTELFANTGNANFPFERVSGGFMEIGCLARESIQKVGGIVFWLGRNEFGQGQIFMATEMNPQRISTHAVEEKISTYANPENATAYTYQMDGHIFYVINFAEGTWAYDVTTRMWHERLYTNEGALERHRADVCAFIPQLNMHLAGDYANNKVYNLNPNYYYDDLTEISKIRRSPHISNGGKMVFYNSLLIDMETGIGLETGLGSDPQVMLRFSDDGGHTWKGESWVSAGKKIGGIGEFLKRVIWRRLGKSRDKVFEIKITDPVPVTILNAEIDIEGGRS